jgi:methionyl-tRNA formyltransferase
MTVRVAFLGNDRWSVPSLEGLAGDPDVDLALVLTNPPRPAGRGDALRPTAVAEAARRVGVEPRETEGVAQGAGFEAIAGAAPDVLVVVAYGRLIPGELLAMPPFGGINLHFSLLPRWRGAAPVRHAILAGDEMTGVTVMRMDEGLDTGPVLAQLEDPIRPEDDAGGLGDRLSVLGARLLLSVVRRLPDGDLPARAQDPAGVTLAPTIGPGDRDLDWAEPADALARRVRAMAPEPGARTTFRGAGLLVLEAAAAPDAGGPPGTIVAHDARGVLVAAGQGGLRLVQVAPAGRRRMAAGDWARGARFAPDERLG